MEIILNLNEEQARRWVEAHIPQDPDYWMAHRLFGWHNRVLVVPIFAKKARRRRKAYPRSGDLKLVGRPLPMMGALRLKLLALDSTHTRLQASADTPFAKDVLGRMEKLAVASMPEAPPSTRPSERPTQRDRGPTEEVSLRAKLFRGIKEQDPDLTYNGLAQRANEAEQPQPPYTGDTVRNAYRAMRAWCERQGKLDEAARWDWSRGRRTR
ncbi:MAG: hypothetical protein ACYC5M_10630 [Anaerolineae bacterium]